MELIYKAFGYMLGLIYGVVENYGVSLILLTVLIKFILLPLTLKQQKSMTKMQKIQPRLKEIQDKYANDKDKAAQETMKLYKEYGVNPAGGCLPLLIQFPILIAFYQVIQKPVQYMLGKSTKEITALCKDFGISNKAGAQIRLAEKMGEIDFDFFSIDLSKVPWDQVKTVFEGAFSVAVLTALIIPVLSCLTTYLTSKVSSGLNKKKEEPKEEKKPQRVLSPDRKPEAENTGESMTKTMTLIMPFMTLWLTFTLPAALGLYWTVSNVLSMLQTVLLNSYYNKKLSNEIAEKDRIREERIQEKMKKYNMKKKKRG